MSLIQSARMNGHDTYAYLKDVLMRLPTPGEIHDACLGTTMLGCTGCFTLTRTGQIEQYFKVA